MGELHGKLGQGAALLIYGGALFALFKLEFHPLAFLGGGAAMIGAGLFFGFGAFRRWQMMKDIPTSKIRSLAMGNLVEVEGTSTGETVTAPLGDECHYYAYELQELHRDDDSSHWHTVAKGSSGRHFRIEDGTGELLVDTQEANLKLETDETFRLEEDPLPEGVQKALDDHGYGERSEEKEFLFIEYRKGPPMRIIQYTITPDEPVYALGRAETTDHDGEQIPVMRRDEDNDVYIVSDQPESEVTGKQRGMATLHMGAATVGLVLLLVGLLLPGW